MNITKDSVIGELVAQDYRTASVFKKHKIDFCCQGHRSIDDACKNEDLSSDKLISQLEEAITQSSGTNTDFASWPLDLLADYVEKKHHRYVESKIPEIIPFLDKIVRVHGDRHPELLEIAQLFKESAGELSAHMKKEELILFPAIRKLVQSHHSGTSFESPMGSIKNPIETMMHEHDGEGERFRRIAELSDNYTPPADGCTTYRVTFSMLKEFEDDLHLHIHLENNILFPKSIALEESLLTV
ncbi:MAG: iron-sulfur cluster repair di-iron protein [Saprospiraceae bacterium]|nr:iron-sulfur cluster repair di-iron protein [Saprospiraceae bacterium]